ncbi:transketolase [Trinickia caryophylli]|uniref:Transketolase n=1 Tax=Trinickia caryophylli TaxID=28094 RepID=A0A1X7CP10_TRICW|nr:transketolase [Trinickia caryophylli]PMS11263.1 transketolase [Trinickia caryophylli]TRX20116.1 transketolase [Trinickia caryophylli]WQE12534.1 transketolase [Trinickia caryophylli]SME99897.1 transketolase [Trinickia caryophylli]GLU30219.1 transketolase, N-terminal subunit [Trinickia caryophylli]
MQTIEKAEDPLIDDRATDLRAKAHWVWRETLAVHRRAPETRLASSLSSVEIFVALYYGQVLRFDPSDPRWEGRDRCIVSKGHGSICLYPILADLGFFPMEALAHVCEPGSFLGGIPDPVIPGYETVNGSLGHGLGVATGMALGLGRKASDRSVFVVCGDGELHEGANWEAIMFAAQHRLDNLHLIIDDNRISMLGHTDDIVTHDGFAGRLTSFGWDCRTVDGHDVFAVQAALREQKASKAGRPKALIARTLKGHGVPGLEDAPLSHIVNPKPDLLDGLLEKSR